jgi:tripartite-type tricarboxylate transporter receptor subunit TctC
MRPSRRRRAAQALATESVKARLMESGAQPAASTPAELAALLKKDTAKWTKVVKTKGIKAD